MKHTLEQRSTGVLTLVTLLLTIPFIPIEVVQKTDIQSLVCVLAQEAIPPAAPKEIVIYASDLSKRSLSEFNFWDDPSSPGGKLAGTPNKGDELDPPPENDPHVSFKVPVQKEIPYRCWVHMKVGAAKGKSTANMFWIQFSDAVNDQGKEIYKPGTDSYVTVKGPEQQGWHWVGCTGNETSKDNPAIYFRDDEEATIRMQAGMEGVGFDQFVLSPAKYLSSPPDERIVKH